MDYSQLKRGERYLHPAYGELIYVRCYNYRGARWQFRTANKQWLLPLQIDELKELERIPRDAEANDGALQMRLHERGSDL